MIRTEGGDETKHTVSDKDDNEKESKKGGNLLLYHYYYHRYCFANPKVYCSMLVE